MKRIVVWFGLAALVGVAVAGSCSINHRSGEYECETSATCEPGRTCVDGLCVLPGGPPADGPKKDGPPPPDTNTCPSQCTSCEDGKVCRINCQAGANCNQQVVCPQGFNCIIQCNLVDSCRSGINCTGAASCEIQCTARRACRNVTCGLGPCTVSCPAQDSCLNVSCTQSCACDVTCGFVNGSCSNVQCPAPQCDTGIGCTSMPFPPNDSCSSCP
jgi:hypothetical protein